MTGQILDPDIIQNVDLKLEIFTVFLLWAPKTFHSRYRNITGFTDVEYIGLDLSYLPQIPSKQIADLHV